MDTNLALRIVTRLLKIAHETIFQIRDGGTIVHQGSGFGLLEDDTELKADRMIGEAMRSNLLGEPDVSAISIEGMGGDKLAGGMWVCIDPLDGSLNLKYRNGTLGLPISSCVTVLDVSNGLEARFSDILAAGVVDLRSGDTWLVERIRPNVYESRVNGQMAHTLDAVVLDLTSQIVIGEMYYPDNRDMLARSFSGQKGWLRNPGSAAYEMALVSSGTAAAYVCGTQKQHELGAGWALVKGAGGVGVDFDGLDLGNRRFEFNTQTPVILACSEELALDISQRITTC